MGLPALVLLASLTAASDPPYAVGSRDVAWPNPTGRGSATLAARVLYPATTPGSNTPILPQAGGWPVIVFLHGFALLGNSYGALGTAWAEHGFVVVLSNTAQFDNLGQERDGRALLPALQAANAAAGGPFNGAFDLGRVALAGHSMGGGNVANVLAINPGYRAGFAIAPVPPRPGNGPAVGVQVGAIAGNGDTVTPPGTNAILFYQSLVAVGDLRFLYLLNGDATHTNLAGLFVSGAVSTAVFQRSAAVGLGFLRHALAVDPAALDSAIGPPALAEPRLVALDLEFRAPQVWVDAPLALGTTIRASIGAEPGIAALAAAPGGILPPLPTPLGDLLLDPAAAYVAAVGVVGAARRLDNPVAVPNAPPLVGLGIALQALGPTPDAPLRLGRGAALSIAP